MKEYFLNMQFKAENYRSINFVDIMQTTDGKSRKTCLKFREKRVWSFMCSLQIQIEHLQLHFFTNQLYHSHIIIFLLVQRINFYSIVALSDKSELLWSPRGFISPISSSIARHAQMWIFLFHTRLFNSITEQCQFCHFRLELST